MKITIVGGGLAGMVAALRLAERGCQVDLYEAGARLGGKAGAERHGGGYDEHGYHIFPMWYRNIWQLVEELGIEDNFVDVEKFMQVRAGEFPRYRTLTNLGSIRYIFKNLLSGVMPFTDMVLFFFSTIDLMSQSFSYRAFLDQTSVNGFIRGRFYRTERVALQHQDLLLKGISVPSYDVSAMTMRNVLRFWLRYPEPMQRILKGNLQKLWIEPLQSKLESLGVRIYFGYRLEIMEWESNRVTRIALRKADGTVKKLNVERLVLAIPWEKLASVLDEAAYRAAPTLFNIRYLESAPMAALNLYFNRRLEGIPPDHVNLPGSRFGLSFIDIGQWWPEHAGQTVINAIASDFTPLAALPHDTAINAMINDLCQFIPVIKREEIVRVDLQPHTEEPLFMNTVGAWRYRPSAKTEIDNLYLAGDYCRSHIDLVSMEGAVSTGLLAAEAVRSDLMLAPSIEVLQPEVYPRWLLWIIWLLLLPVAAFFKIITLITREDEQSIKT